MAAFLCLPRGNPNPIVIGGGPMLPIPIGVPEDRSDCDIPL